MMKRLRQILRMTYLRIQRTLKNQSGASVIEWLLVLVVVIGLTMIFKIQLTNMIMAIFQKIARESAAI